MQEYRRPFERTQKFSAGSDDSIPRPFIGDTLMHVKDLRRAEAAQALAVFPGVYESDSGGSSYPSPGLPILDPGVLTELEEQVDEPSLVLSFVRDFLEATGVRFRKLESAIAIQNLDATVDAVLGIKTTSMMVGAASLAQMAAECEAFVRNGDFDAASASLPGVRACVDRTIAELRESYLAG